jgi:hypothetical protein
VTNNLPHYIIVKITEFNVLYDWALVLAVIGEIMVIQYLQTKRMGEQPEGKASVTQNVL